MTEHRTDWHRLSIRTDDGIEAEAEALGWWPGYGGTWVLDRVVDGDALAYAHEVTDLGPADVLALPEPRVFRAGDPEPGDDVRAVLDRDGDVLIRNTRNIGEWFITGGWYPSPWSEMLTYGPLVEVILPEPVTA